MISFIKLISKVRKQKPRKIWKLNALGGSPFRRGICVRIYITTPKKPNSAQRKVVKVRLSSGYSVIVGIPGIGFKIMQYSNVLVRGGRVPDVPGVRYKLVRGLYDFQDWELYGRKKRRSKFGKPRDVTLGDAAGVATHIKTRIPYKRVGSS